MREELKTCYRDICDRISQDFFCEELSAFTQISEDFPWDPEADLDVVYAAVLVGLRGRNRPVYDIARFRSDPVDIQKDFQELLERAFLPKMAATFSANNIDFMMVLFQHFVHDGEFTPTAISEVTLSDVPPEIKSEAIALHYQEACEIYAFPTSLFVKEYENWNVNAGYATIRGDIYPMASESNMAVDSILKKENLTPILRHVIKLWIIHRLVSEFKIEDLKNSKFFNTPDMESELMALQQNITDKIKNLLRLSQEERRAVAKSKKSENIYSLSPWIFKLAQRFPLFKIFVGHSHYDIHQCRDQKLSFRSQVLFYLQSHLNLVFWKYLFSKSKKNWLKSKTAAHKFIAGEARWTSLPKAYWQLLKSCFLILWLPFIGTYLTVSGLTSLPFSGLRQTLGLSFDGWANKSITVIEALKDLGLLAIALPLTYLGLTAISAVCLGTFGLELAAISTYYLFMTLSFPILLVLLEESFHTFPGWVVVNGYKVYKEQSDYASYTQMLRGISTNKLISLHGFILVFTLAAFTGIVGISYLVNQALQFFNPKRLNNEELYNQVQNLSHSLKFRKFLASLAQKAESLSSDKTDQETLSTLYLCKLPEKQKKTLKEYLKQKLADESTPDKRTLSLARQYIDAPSYLPSWKLIDRLKRELPDESSPELKEAVKRIHDVYSNKLTHCI